MFDTLFRSLHTKMNKTGVRGWKSPLFDPVWYKKFYGLKENEDPLNHFIRNSKGRPHNPNAFFDVRFYAETYMKGLHPTALEVVGHYSAEGERQGCLPSGDFDPRYYAKTYPEVRDYPGGSLAHYIRYGRSEKKAPFELFGRKLDPLCSSLHGLDLCDMVMTDALSEYFAGPEEVKHFFTSSGRLPEDVPLRFCPGNYTRYNSDLAYLSDSPPDAIKHYLLHGFREERLFEDFNAGECEGMFYQVLNIPGTALKDYKPGIKVCVLVHIFYPELYEELKINLNNLSGQTCDIYFNLVENNWTSHFHSKVMADFPKARVIVSRNRGRDIGGFFNLLSNIRSVRAYDAYLLIHSKTSPHIPETVSAKWRKDLLGATIGSPGIVLQNLYLLEKLPATGLIGSKYWRRRSIDGNTKKYHQLMKILGISKKNYPCDYLSGTMMWVNARVIDYLYSRCRDLEFEDGNSKPLDFHKDGQWAHAMERAFGNICQQLKLEMIFR